jgi:hypothetical protein
MYVYKFLNEQEEIIYIGRTKNLKKRIETHNHLPSECYDEADKIEYIKLDSTDEGIIYEMYLINKISPKYNTEFNKSPMFEFELPEKEWKVYEDKDEVSIKKTKPNLDKYAYYNFNDSILYKPSYLIDYIKTDIKNSSEILTLNCLLWHCQNCDEDLILDIMASYCYYDHEKDYKKTFTTNLKNLVDKTITYKCEETEEIKTISILDSLEVYGCQVFYKLNTQIEKDLKALKIDSDRALYKNRYVKLYNKYIQYPKEVGFNRTLIFYEYLMFKKSLDTKSKYIKININKFKELLFCENYNKNSQLLIRVLNPIIKNLEIHYDLKVYYKCELNAIYKRISSIIFEVFNQGSNQTNYETTLKFQSQEELNMMIEQGYTNISNLNINTSNSHLTPSQ